MSIPSEVSILSYCNIFITHRNIPLKKLADNIYHPWKTDLVIIVVLWIFSVLFKGKLSSALNLIFMKSFSYSPGLPQFIVTVSFLIPSQTSVCFINTSLFSSVGSKTKYLLPSVSPICPITLPMIRYRGFKLWMFS